MDPINSKAPKQTYIVLFGLKNINTEKDNIPKQFYDIDWMCYKKEKEKKEKKEKTKEEIKKEVEKEILKDVKSKIKNSKKYYKIDSNKKLELEKVFKEIKLNMKFPSNPKFLRNGNIYTISNNNVIIYENKFFKQLHEFKFGDKYKIESVIQLDNKDLVFLSNNEDYTLLVYRLKDNNYSLIQEIKEDRTGFKLQVEFSGCTDCYPKDYSPNKIKDISGNKFFCVSNYGIKLYSLNGKNEYSVILVEKYLNGVQIIHEINENNFIFCTDEYHKVSMVANEHYEFSIEKLDLRQITKDNLTNKLKDLNDTKSNYDTLSSFYYFDKKREIKEKEIDKDSEKVINSLNLTMCFNHQYDDYLYWHDDPLICYDYIILKNKYFMMMADNYLFVFNLQLGILSKIFTILIEGEKSLYIEKDIKIQRWNSKEENEFILLLKGNLLLFELTKKEELKILNLSYFPNINNLKKINDKENTFYEIKSDSLLIY